MADMELKKVIFTNKSFIKEIKQKIPVIYFLGVHRNATQQNRNIKKAAIY